MRKDEFISNYLFSRLKKESLLDLFTVIIKGMNNYHLCFNDSLLFLCKLINNQEFNNNIKNITKNCLSYQNKSQEKISFFKNHLLNSNIWCKNINENENDVKSQENENETLFKLIKRDVLENELNIHKKYLKNELIE